MSETKFHTIQNHRQNYSFVGPFSPRMARPQAADGGDGLQIWRVAANILNEQSRTAKKGGPPALVLGVELTTKRK
jgi:hypothetical protein